MALISAVERGSSMASLFRVDGPARARAYRRASRHSRLVRVLRILLPIGFLAALALIALATLAPWRALAPAEVTMDSISADGSSMTMARPKLSGYRRDGRPFALTAEKAVQDLGHPNLAALTDVSGRMAVSDALDLRLAAGAGLYDNATQRLSVTKDVSLSSDAFELRLQAAEIDFRLGALTSDGRVLVTRKDGSRIEADAFTAADNGRQLTFSGHVRTTIHPSDEAAQGGTP